MASQSSLESTCELFKEITEEITFIVPLLQRSNHSVRASALRLVQWTNWPGELGDNSTFHVPNAHFASIPIECMDRNFPLCKEFLRSHYDTTVRNLQHRINFEKKFNLEVASCVARMNLVTRYMDDSRNINEANVRMMAGNEIVLMLCSLHDFTFQVEDKMVADEEIPTTSSRVTDLITPRSATDYICFRVEGPMNVNVAAVLLETKADYT